MEAAGVVTATGSVTLAAATPIAQAVHSRPLIILHNQQVEGSRDSIIHKTRELIKEESYSPGTVSIHATQKLINSSLQILNDAPWPIPKDELRALSIETNNTMSELQRLEQVTQLFVGPTAMSSASSHSANNSIKRLYHAFQRAAKQGFHRHPDSTVDGKMIHTNRQNDLTLPNLGEISTWTKLKYYFSLQHWYSPVITHLMLNNEDLQRLLECIKDAEKERLKQLEVWGSIFRRVAAELESIEEKFVELITVTEKSVWGTVIKELSSGQGTACTLAHAYTVMVITRMRGDDIIKWFTEPLLPFPQLLKSLFTADPWSGAELRSFTRIVRLCLTGMSQSSTSNPDLELLMHWFRIIWIFKSMSNSTKMTWSEDTISFCRNILPPPQKLHFETVKSLVSRTSIKKSSFPHECFDQVSRTLFNRVFNTSMYDMRKSNQKPRRRTKTSIYVYH